MSPECPPRSLGGRSWFLTRANGVFRSLHMLQMQRRNPEVLTVQDLGYTTLSPISHSGRLSENPPGSLEDNVPGDQT